MAKEKRQKFITPAGTFKFPALTKPDFGNEKFPQPNGVYKVVLILSRAEAQVLIDKLQPLYDEAVEKGQEEFGKLKVETRKKLKSITENPLFSEVYDKETEEPTGDVEFSFKMVASGTNKKGEAWSRKPDLFDAKGKPLKGDVAIWGGTKGKVCFTTNAYFIPATGAVGLSLKLEAAQVIELVSSGSRSASSYGFGEEEGYEFEESDAAPFSDESGSTDSSSTDGDNEDF